MKMGILSKLQGEHRTPLRVGLTMLAANLCVVVGFCLSIAAIVLLGLTGLNIPPWIVILAFGVVALCLWVFLGMSFPSSFSIATAMKSTIIGLSPIALVTAAEYTFLIVDPEGCVGAHILLLILGSLSLVLVPSLTVGGLVVKRRLLKRP